MALPTTTWVRVTGSDSEHRPVESPGVTLPPLYAYVTINGKRLRVVGARLRAKYNVIVADANGKRTCYKDTDVARMWTKQEAERVALGEGQPRAQS
jgi:hypothetical protein